MKGTLWTMLGASAPVAVGIFTTPLLTRLLGAEQYGLLVLVLLIPTYFAFADFGMNVASTRFASEAFAAGDLPREARIVRTAALIALLSSLPFAIGMVVFSAPLLHALNVPEPLLPEATIALRFAAVAFVVDFLNATLNTPQLTRVRMELNIFVTYGARTLGMLAAPGVVYLGGGVIGAVLATLTASLIGLAGHIAVSSRLLPELLATTLDRPSIRPLLRFGGSLLVAYIAGMLLANADRVILTKATTVTMLAYYSVAAAVARLLSLASGSMQQALIPVFSQLQGEAGLPALRNLYSRSIRLTLIWLVPAILAMVLFGVPFFTYWFGAEFGRESSGPFFVIIAGAFVNVLAYFPYTVIIASGRSELIARIYWLEVIPFIILAWILSSRFGALGAAMAWSTRVIIDSAAMFGLARIIYGISMGRKTAVAVASAACLAGIPLIAAIYYRELNFAVLLLTLVCGLAAILLSTRVFITPEEFAWGRTRVEQMWSSARPGRAG